MRKIGSWGLALAIAALLAACATSGGRKDKLQEAQYAWSAAIRWGDFEGAWTLVDPAYREAHPMSPVEFERFKQIGISAYHDLGQRALGEDDVVREIELGVINKHTMTERSMRYTERWHYDVEGKTWWQTSGLPDLWQGE